MTPAFSRGYLDADFVASEFTSAPRLLVHSVALFLRNLPFLAAVTLVVLAPVKFGLHLLFEVLDVPTNGVLSYFLDGAGTFVATALVLPAAIYGLLGKLRSGSAPPLGECLRWGQRQWLRTLWNLFKVDVTVTLYGALLVVPGLVKMTKLILAGPVVATEGDRVGDPLGRSEELTEGHRWTIFFVLFPLGVLDLAATFLILQTFRGSGFSWTAVAAVDCVMAVLEQLGTVAVLLMYLGLRRR